MKMVMRSQVRSLAQLKATPFKIGKFAATLWYIAHCNARTAIHRLQYIGCNGNSCGRIMIVWTQDGWHQPLQVVQNYAVASQRWK